MRVAVLLVFALCVVLLGAPGGAGHPWDEALIRHFVQWRADHPAATRAIVAFTQLGGGWVLLPLTGAAAGWLWWRGRRDRVLFLVACVLGGRFAVEGIKLLVDRPRPSFDLHPVTVFSQSFPSAHAANSTITFLALALALTPEAQRSKAIAAAILLALAVGATRPVLGVHWPSDVIAGWLFGTVWVGLSWALLRRAGSEA